MEEPMPWLHVRGQFTNHFEAEIVGTLEGLKALQSALEVAIAEREGKARVIASDGEGYSVVVRKSATVAGLGRTLYLDQAARELALVEHEFWIKQARYTRDKKALKPKERK